ncbi:MAG: 50S ribosomal protein L22 [Eubacteriaceae bacterium]|nr:50S ribosomal protein L22 [Eubacteriaceae bacterium]
MQSRATAKYVRVSSIKAKRVADLIRGKNIHDAINICRLTNNKPSRAFEKVLHSALANAQNNQYLDGDDMFVLEAHANQGPTMKRMKAKSRGRGTIYHKRSSHLSVVLEERN